VIPRDHWGPGGNLALRDAFLLQAAEGGNGKEQVSRTKLQEEKENNNREEKIYI